MLQAHVDTKILKMSMSQKQSKQVRGTLGGLACHEISSALRSIYTFRYSL